MIDNNEVTWRCCECRQPDLSGGIKQTSKKYGLSYFCGPVKVYLGKEGDDLDAIGGWVSSH